MNFVFTKCINPYGLVPAPTERAVGTKLNNLFSDRRTASNEFYPLIKHNYSTVFFVEINFTCPQDSRAESVVLLFVVSYIVNEQIVFNYELNRTFLFGSPMRHE